MNINARAAAHAHRLPVLLCALMLLASFALWADNRIGLPAGKLERDARRDVGEALQMSRSTGSSVGALLFYDGVFGEGWARRTSLRLYVNRPGLSFGWFFRGGLTVPEGGVAVYAIEGYTEKAYVSQNLEGVCRAVLDDGVSVTTYELDASAPFALVSGANPGVLTFYTADGTAVPVSEARRV